jgi:pimeloyl-ACP methyl ester carboxylesterase
MHYPIEVRNINIQMNGTQLPVHYMQSGEGPPMVLLHGLGDSAYTWQWVIQPMARDHRIYSTIGYKRHTGETP